MIAAIKRVPGQPVKNRNASVALIAVGMLALGATASEAGHRKSWRDANASIGSSSRSFSGKASFYGNESGSRTASVRVSRDREHGFQRIVSNDFRGS